MKTLTFLIAAVGMLIIPSRRPSSPKEDGDGVGLFIGSARPLAVRQPVRTRRR